MKKNRIIFAIGLSVSLVFVLVGCVWLSNSAETLDEVAEQFGAHDTSVWDAPLANYEIPGLEGNIFGNIALGMGATVFILGLTLVTGRTLKSKK